MGLTTSELSPRTVSLPNPTEAKTVFSSARFDVIEHQVIAANSETIQKHTVQHPGAVAILALVDDDHICLIRNERVAVGKTLVELPAGTLEPDEPPSKTAERELQEETGYSAKYWHELNGFYMSPGILNERMHLFVARELTAGAPAREAGEEIDNLVVHWDEAVAMALRGEIEDAKSIAAILLWDRLRENC